MPDAIPMTLPEFLDQPVSVGMPKIRCTTHPEHMEVHGNLILGQNALVDLPDHLVVHGNMFLVLSPITRLPARLVVDKDLAIKHTPVTDLSQHLHVGESLVLDETGITALPENLWIGQILNVQSTPIQTLRPGLHVGNALLLSGTQVREFPSDMQVGGVIDPPPGLSDMVRFMDDHPDVEVISLSGSQHVRMQGLQRLAPYPDLMRVMLSITPGAGLHITRTTQGSLHARIGSSTG